MKSVACPENFYICCMPDKEYTEAEKGKAVAAGVRLIDIDKVIKDKSPTLKKLLPGFVTGLMKRLIHQEFLNTLLIHYGHLNGIEFIDAVLKDMNTKLDVIGLENIPKKDRCIIASNHPLGGLDGMALMLAVSRARNDIVFPVNDLLMNIKTLQVLFIPINKLGSNTENIRIINETFASDKIICYFPFGLVSRKKRGVIKDLEWKPTFITKAKRFKRDVVPTFISGKNSNHFYTLANLRKRLHIKTNFEMMLLPDELSRQKNQTIKITFGKRVSYRFFDKRFTSNQWAELMRQYIYMLDSKDPEPFEKWVEGRNPG